MNISVIIPTLDASSSIGRLVSALFSQETRPQQIIVIDSASTDDTVTIAQEYGAKTITIPERSFNHGKTRNMAAEEASGDVLVFMTQDALPADEKMIGALTAPLQIPDIAAAFGRHIPAHDANPLDAFARYFNYPSEGAIKGIDDIPRFGIKTFFFSNVCSAIKKNAFMTAGRFPEDIRANEDMLIAAKLILTGFRVAYVPDARVIHSHNYSLLKQFRRYYNIGSSLKTHDWVLQHVRAEGEGLRFVGEQMRFAVQRHRYLWIPYILMEAAAKYAGYRSGLILG
jgi:rhamnosyltransferase